MTRTTLSYPRLAKEATARLAGLRAAQPALMDGARCVAEAAVGSGVLPAKTKELIALALSVAARCDACIALHVKALVRLGATRAEVEETLAVAVYMGGAPALMCTASALAAFEQFEERRSA